jgi:hypothetical protein
VSIAPPKVSASPSSDRRPTARRARAALYVCLLTLGAAAMPANAVKTDVVVLLNGDRVTGEVRELASGRLRYKTDDMGTLYIEWLNVAQLTSATVFEVETTDARRFIGRLEPRGDSMLAVIDDDQVDLLPHLQVVRMTRLDAGFMRRLDGSFDLGLTYTQADHKTQFNFNLEVDQRRPAHQTSIDFSGILTDEEEGDDTRRFDATFAHLGLRRAKWFTHSFATAQGNNELGLDLRVLAGFGLGRNAIQTNRTLMRGSVGLAVMEEWPTSGASEEEIEAMLGGSYSFFTFDYPNTSVDIRLTLFHGVSSDGALRAEGDVSVRRELWKDLYISVSAYESYDADPIVATAVSNDYGLTTSIGWSF